MRVGCHQALVLVIASASAILTGAPAYAQDVSGAASSETERTPIGVTVDFGVASAYGYRGLNLAAESTQHDQRLLMQPSVAYAMPDTGLTVTYFSSYQATGERRRQVDAAMSDEQDLSVSFEREVADGLSIEALFGAFVYPMGTEEAAGTDVPVYLEPGLSATWSTVVDLSLSSSFFFGVQDALRSQRYVYINPKLGKTLEMTSSVSLTGSLGYGVKGQAAADNRHDVLVDVSASFAPSEFFYVSPGVHWAWTNLEGSSFVDEQFGWVSTNVGSTF